MHENESIGFSEKKASISGSKLCSVSEDYVPVKDDDPIENWRGLAKPKATSAKTVKSRRSQISILQPQVRIRIIVDF